MSIQRIFSKNAAYQQLEVLKTNRNKRLRYGEFLVEGVRSINEAVKNGWDIRRFVYADGEALSGWAQGMLQNVRTQCNLALAPALMRELSEKDDTSELLAVIGMRTETAEDIPLSACPVIALFDRPSNRGNLGTIIRSCDALGVDALLVTGHAVDIYDPEVVVAAMGSFFNMHVVHVPQNAQVDAYIARLKSEYPGLLVVGTTAHKQHPLYSLDLTKPVLFMIGNETDGLCAAFYERCDVTATIPMADTSYASSFNVGCAATVMFYEAARQRAQACAKDPGRA